jgi:hypothetical protein
MPRKPDSLINRIAAAVAQKPGCTGAELSYWIGEVTAYRRLSEIERLGLIKKGERRTCNQSLRVAVTWYPDDRPAEPDRGKLTHAQEIKRLKARIKFLEEENAQLRQQLEVWNISK